MIFKIADGREYFYQWDIDRQIIVSDPTIKEVHFCNRTDVCSLVVEVVDGVANVPNKVLQSGFDVRVFGYDGKATMHETTFEVKARTQPTDYVYTEVEIKRYSDLEKRIEEMESATAEAIGEAVNEYLEEHPITMDGYATKNYVDTADATLNLLIAQHNHDGQYAPKNHTHSDYATETYVDEAVKNVKVDVNLDDYAKKTDIPDVSKFITSIPSEYVTETELEAKKYATKTELNSKANTNHTHSTADVDGLQKALNEKATQADIDKAISLHDHRYDYAPIEHSHGDEYAAKTHTHSYNNLLDKPTIPSVEGLASEAYVNAAVANIKIPDVNLEGYATEKYVDDAITDAQLAGGDVDLSNYYTKEETEALIPDVSEFISEIPSEYITESELNAKGYLTEHQSLEGYATEAYVDEAIANIDIPVGPGGDVDLTGYATEEYVNNALANVGAGGYVVRLEEPIALGATTSHKEGSEQFKKLETISKHIYEVVVTLTDATAQEECAVSIENVMLATSTTASSFTLRCSRWSLDPVFGCYEFFIDCNKSTQNGVAYWNLSVRNEEFAMVPASKEYVDEAIANKYYNISDIANPSAEDYAKLAEIKAAGELASYYFKIGNKHSVLRTEVDPMSGAILFVYGDWTFTTGTIYAYLVNPATSTSRLYTSYELATTQAIQDAINAIGVAEGGAY